MSHPAKRSSPAPLRLRSWRGLAQLALDAGLGALIALGQAPWGLWPVSIFALSLLLARLGARRHPARAGLHALLAGCGYFALAMSWITEPFLVDAARYGWMAPFALIFMAFGGGLFWALPTAAGAALGRNAVDRCLAIALALILSDWLRGWIFTGLPWALFGHVWIDTPLGQSASFWGAIGLSAATLLGAALPAMSWLRAGQHAPMLRPLPGLMIAALLMVGLWFWGVIRLNQPLPPDGAQIIRIVQPNADQALKWDPAHAAEFWYRLLDETGATAEQAPDLVVWPETAVSFLLSNSGEAPEIMSETAQAPVLFGVQRAEGLRYFNSLAEITEAGEIGQIYDKFHLVPFGEYIPWGGALARLGASAFSSDQGYGYTPGPGPQIMQVADLPPFQPLICYEAVFPQHLRGLETRPQWLLQITNDAWFGTQSGPWQHLAQARLRAIETGLPLIRAANTGISAMIDARGALRGQIGLNQQGHLDAPLPAALAPTWWLRLGPAPLLVVIFLALFALLLRRKASNPL